MSVREKIAEFAHSQWSGWMRYLFGKCAVNEDGTVTIPAWAVSRWKRQMETEYVDLQDDEKDSDRREADKFFVLLSQFEAEQVYGPRVTNEMVTENSGSDVGIVTTEPPPVGGGDRGVADSGLIRADPWGACHHGIV